MKLQIARVTSSCVYQLFRLKHVRHSVGQELTTQPVHAFVLSTLNSVLARLPKSTIAPLQRAQNAAARLILGLQWHDHVTTALPQLHWLSAEAQTKWFWVLVRIWLRGMEKRSKSSSLLP